MRVRDYEESDYERVKQLFLEQGFEYQLPSFEEEQFVIRHVLVNDDGEVVQALFARKTVELFLISDQKWETPLWRFHGLGFLHRTMKCTLHMMGFRDAHLWMPPQLEKSFGRRLMRCFDWKRQIWPSYVREVV